MITIAWYNAVAITVGLLFLFLIWKENRMKGSGAFSGCVTSMNVIAILVCAALFFAIWGGIFWW
jgi:hypothetical protein